jgi:hypothetical protein
MRAHMFQSAGIDPRIDKIVAARMPLVEDMRRLEREAGHEVVLPGEAAWLPAADWSEACVVSLDRARAEVRIVVVISLRPGSFRRLVEAVRLAGFTPVVVGPMGPVMPAILKRWGWRGDYRGYEYRPPQRGPWTRETRA